MKVLELFFFLALSNAAMAQNFDIGGSLFSTMQSFDHNMEEALVEKGFRTYFATNLGASILIKTHHKNGFNLEAGFSFAPKTIRLVHENTFSRHNFLYFQHELLGLDFSIVGRYPLLYKKLKFTPFLGFTLSGGAFYDFAIGVGGSSGIGGNGTNQGSTQTGQYIIEYEERTYFTPFITFGNAFTLFENERHWVELFVRVQYSPRKILSEPLVYKLDTGSILLEDNLNGKWYGLQLGVSYFLVKPKY